MRINNKKVICLFGALLLVLATGSTVLAQEDEKGSSDHPLISRFPGSYIMTYDLKQFNEYMLPMGKMLNDTLEKSQKLEGKVTQITYAAPKDRSVLEIYRNYEIFLKSAGFVTLFSSKKEELGNNWLNKYISATPRAYRYGAPGLQTRIEGNFNYLVAKKVRTEGDVYVTLCVATSWFQNFPVIQLDVIEIIPMDTDMAKVTPEPSKINEQTTTPQTDQSTLKDLSDQTILKEKTVKSFELRIGAGCYAFSDPVLAGTSANNFMIYSTGAVTGSLTGFRLLTGPYFNARYFFNENFGISADLGYLGNHVELYTTYANYSNTANLFFQKAGLIGQIIGKSTPIRLSTTLGAGNCITELYKQTIHKPTVVGLDTYLKGKANMFVVFFNLDVSFPIYKKLFLFGNYEYNVIPVSEFVMEHSGGSEYSDTYYNMNFGGFHFRVGLSYSF